MSLSRNDFLAKYTPMAKAGKTAAEIAEATGLEVKAVTAKATHIRKTVRSAAEVRGASQGLADKELSEFVAATVDKLVPKLTSRSTGNVLDSLEELFATDEPEAEAEAETETPAE